MKSDFIIALTQLAAERNLPREIVLSAIEAALVSAYKRDSVAFGQDISVKLDPGSGEVSVYAVKTAVEEVSDPDQEIELSEARKLREDAQVGEVVATQSLGHIAGRIAAQTAKQVVMQRLREAERDLVFQEYADKEGDVFTATVQRMEPKQLIVEMGRAEAILPASEQAPYERYRIGQKIKVLLQSIRQSNKGPEIIVSRADKLLLKRLFEIEVPEIYNGSVEIVAIAREAGWRSKVAVWAKQDGVDAVGSCVGLRGIRIQNIVNELHGEKIDVVQWSKDPAAFISSSLSPSMVMRVDLDEEAGTAVAIVPERQLSLAIGKEGQNARLAARLTGWKVDIKSDVETAPAEEGAKAAPVAVGPDMALEHVGLATRVLNVLKQSGVDKVAQILEMEKSDLLKISGFGKKALDDLYGRLGELNLLPTEPVDAAPQPVEAAPEEVAVVEAEEPEAAAPVEVPSEESVAATAEPGEAKPEEKPVVEEAAEVLAAVQAAAEVATEGAEAPAEEKVPAEPVSVPAGAGEAEKPEAQPVGVTDTATSIDQLPDNVWSTRGLRTLEPGVIRFAEDIDELNKARTGSRRGRRTGGSQGGAARRGPPRRTKARKRR